MEKSVMNLWGEEFSVEETPLQNKSIIKKASEKKEVKVSTEKKIKSKKLSIEEKIELIREDVNKILGKYKENTVTIKSYFDFVKYIDACINNGVMSIDTETDNSLNTFDCLIMGLCLYTPGQKHAYIPVNHTDMLGNKHSWQVTEGQIKAQLERCTDVFKVFHNATFDIEVTKQTCGIKLYADWDTMVGAQLLDENEPKGLKMQYKLHVNPEQDKYDIEHLFKGLPYSIIDPDLFALYAATDAYETYKLYEYQKKEFEKPDNKDIYNLFKNIEIPILDVVVDMELMGVEVDLDYAKKLSKVYHKKTDEVQAKVDEELSRLKPVIDSWRLTPEANEKGLKKGWSYVSGSGGPGDMPYFVGPDGKQYTSMPDGRMMTKSKSEQLADPPELGSPTQMAILLYDVLKVPVVDKKTPRGTGADILKELSKSVPLCRLLDEKRGYDILINTFIDKIPEVVQKDGRVHARFNTCGTATGRFSSSDPNLQNIPSHAKDIRMIFKAPKGYSIVGSDYSGQEMRVLASVANDKEMISAYENNQDIYAKVASLIYKNEVEDNLEFPPSWGGRQNPEGKERRSKAKTACLGLNYGMSTKSLAERFDTTLDEAQKIVDGYYGGLSGVKKYTDDSQTMLKTLGYVTDLFGRRRHIPDATLPDYEFITNSSKFNPLLFSKDIADDKTESLIRNYKFQLSNAKWKKDKDLIVESAKKDGIVIKSNNGFISRALRQCLNARIQGSSASMTKLAMIMAHNDKELNELGFKLVFTVHDEFAGIAPRENAQRVGERLCEVMIDAAKVKCGNVPWKCDPYMLVHWYADEFSGEVLREYNECNDILEMQRKYPAIKPEYIEKMCKGEFNVNLYEDI